MKFRPRHKCDTCDSSQSIQLLHVVATLQIFVLEVPASHLGRVTGCFDSGWFFSPTPGECWGRKSRQTM